MEMPGMNTQGMMGQMVLAGTAQQAERQRLAQEAKARRNMMALDLAKTIFSGIGTIGGLFKPGPTGAAVGG